MMQWKSDEKGYFWACSVFAGIFLVFIFNYAISPIYDNDLWWHIKSGEMMVQAGDLLQSDPFTFTGDGVISDREIFILKNYWLWQLTAYGLYALLGFNGIFLLNLLTVGAMAGVVSWQMRRQGVGCVYAIFLMTLGFYLLRVSFPLERPQVVSFLGATLLLSLLSSVREGGRLGWSLPLLMMVWANLHGGFVVGDLILVCFAVGTVMEYRHNLPRLHHLLSWIAIGIGASLLNPTGPMVFKGLLSFHNSELMVMVSEYQSTWLRFQLGYWSVAILWMLILLYAIGIWSSRRFFWPEIFVGLFLAYFSFAYMRNVGLFAVPMLPAIGFHLQQGSASRSWRLPPLFVYLIISVVSFGLLWHASAQWQRMSRGEKVVSTFPEKASQFILSSGVSGRMFNSYNHGGYLIWKLYPQHLVFIDGRGLDAAVFHDWALMTGASLQEVGGRKEFEVLLERYGIDFVVQPHIYQDSGRLTPLLKFLIVKPEWIPVYVDQVGYILVRKSKENEEVVARYRMDKREFNNKVIGYLRAFCKGSPENVVNHVALAEMLIFVGRYDEAEDRLEVITRMQSENIHLPALRSQLNALRNEKKL